MSNSYINDLLEKAVREVNLIEVRNLLSRGADINIKIEQDKETLLHYTSNVEMTKELLLHGAHVNYTNKYRETPLHCAVTKEKKLDVIKELLKHGANVNATDRKGNNPLNKAVQRSDKDLKLIKELLQYGADINMRNFDKCQFPTPYSIPYCTPLDYAVYYLEPAKLLIKITIMKKFDCDYKKYIDLTPYKTIVNYSELVEYFDECVCEIVQMKTDKFNDNLSLYKFTIMKNAFMKTLYAGNKITEQGNTKYPIYQDIISDKVMLYNLERASLLNKFNDLQIYTRSKISNEDVKEKEVLLNYDSVYAIAEYLSSNDLQNLVIAFCKVSEMKLDEPSTSKRARLE